MGKNPPIGQIVAKIVAKPKNVKNIYIKVQYESPKHLNKTTFESLKYLQKNCAMITLI
jgi:hypothetical protein